MSDKGGAWRKGAKRFSAIEGKTFAKLAIQGNGEEGDGDRCENGEVERGTWNMKWKGARYRAVSQVRPAAVMAKTQTCLADWAQAKAKN